MTNKQYLEKALEALAFAIFENSTDSNWPVEKYIERYKEIKKLIEGEN